MSAPQIPLPSDVQQFDELNAVKITVTDLSSATLNVSGATTVGAISAPSVTASSEVVTPSVRSTGGLNLRSATDAVVCHADLLQGSGGQTIGRSDARWQGVFANEVNSAGPVSSTGAVTGSSVTASGAVSGATVTASGVGTFGAQIDANGGIYTQGPANTGFVSTPAGKQLILSSNNKTTGGAGSSSSIQLINNAMYLYDGNSSQSSVDISSGNVYVNKVLYAEDQLITNNRIVAGGGGSGSEGVYTSRAGKQTILTADNKTTYGATNTGSILLSDQALYMYDGSASAHGFKIENGRNNLNYYTVVSDLLALPHFGYAMVNGGGDGGSHNASPWQFDCTNGTSSAFCTWSEDGIFRLGNPNVVSGFQVRHTGFYEVEACTGSCSSSARAILMINGADSVFGQIVASGSVSKATGYVHLNAGDLITAKMGDALGTCQKAGSYIAVRRLQGQTGNIKFLQASGTPQVFGDQ